MLFSVVPHVLVTVMSRRPVEEISMTAEGLSAALCEATKSIQRSFHSQMPRIVQALLQVHIRGDFEEPVTTAARAAHFWTIKACRLLVSSSY